jgi:hypothetical protein
VSYIYFIAPVGSDPQYHQKREILSEISKETRREFFFPLERRQGFSIDQARSDLRNASLLIADLSLERPSCYFELGMAQALEVPVCVIATQGTTLHQTATKSPALLYSDLGDYRIVVTRVVESHSENSGEASTSPEAQ